MVEGRKCEPALVYVRPMPTSGVPKRARSVAMRRSQLAANSRAPPMQTPSMAASTGTGAASAALSRAGRPDGRRPRLGGGVDGGEEVVAGREVLAGAARDTQRTASSAPAASMPSAIASIVSRVQALRFAWRSHVTTRAEPSLAA